MAAPQVFRGAVSGSALSSGNVSGDAVLMKFYYREELIRDKANLAPFVVFLHNMNSEGVSTPVFRNITQRTKPSSDLSTNAVTAGTEVTIPVAHPEYFNDFDIVLNVNANPGTGEVAQGYVVSVDETAGTIKVRPYLKKIGGNTQKFAAVTSGDKLLILAPATPEASEGVPPTWTRPEVNQFNVQQIETYWRVTGIQNKNSLYTEPERDRERFNHEGEHLSKINMALLFQKGGIDEENYPTPRYMLTGLIPLLNDANAEVSISTSSTDAFVDDFTAAMRDIHKSFPGIAGDPNRRVVLVSSAFMYQLQRAILKGFLKPTEIKNSFGLSISQFYWGNYVWDFLPDQSLTDVRDGIAVVFHPRYVHLREYDPTKLVMNVQPNKATYVEDGFITVLGLEVAFPELGRVLKLA